MTYITSIGDFRHRLAGHKGMRDSTNMLGSMQEVQIQEVPCLSLCGILNARHKSETIDCFIQRLSNCLSDAFEPQRIYFGSSFCAQSFLHIYEQDVTDLCMYCHDRDISLTLVVPIITERNLEKGMARIGRFLSLAHGTIDEITVNDIGMLAQWGDGPVGDGTVAVNLGRLFNKDTRDPRSPYSGTAPCRPALLRTSWNGASALERLRRTWPIAGMEFDPTRTAVDLSQLPLDIEPALYGPLCYMSCAQVCEYASIGVEDEQSFRPNMPCTEQCLHAGIEYQGASKVQFLKLGRTVYFRQPACEIIGVKRVRRIFEPLEEVLF